MGKERPRVKNLPAKLRQIRESLGLTQVQIIERLKYSFDLSPGMLSNIELGKCEASMPLVLAYAKLARISTDLLLDDALGLPKDLAGARKTTRRKNKI